MQFQVPEDMREMVLDVGTDEFFAKHAHLTFGEVGMSVKALMEQYQNREAQHRQVGMDLWFLPRARRCKKSTDGAGSEQKGPA